MGMMIILPVQETLSAEYSLLTLVYVVDRSPNSCITTYKKLGGDNKEIHKRSHGVTLLLCSIRTKRWNSTNTLIFERLYPGNAPRGLRGSEALGATLRHLILPKDQKRDQKILRNSFVGPRRDVIRSQRREFSLNHRETYLNPGPVTYKSI